VLAPNVLAADVFGSGVFCSCHKVGTSLIPYASIFLCLSPLPHLTSSKILEVDCSVYLFDYLLNNVSFPGYRTDEAVEFAVICLCVSYL